MLQWILMNSATFEYNEGGERDIADDVDVVYTKTVCSAHVVNIFW